LVFKTERIGLFTHFITVAKSQLCNMEVAKRRRAVDLAVILTEGTTYAASEHELVLLEEFVKGVLTIDEVIEILASEQSFDGCKYPPKNGIKKHPQKPAFLGAFG
jgi:hypothetical protein